LATASLPEEGELQLGTITLPAGKRIRAGYEPAISVAWVTQQPVPDAGMVWATLSAMHHETGLIPFLLGSLPGYPTRPWDEEEFDTPVDPSELDHMNAAEVLAEMWDGEMEDDEVKEDEEWIAMRAPFSTQFPGLAPPGDTPLSPEQLHKTLYSLSAAYRACSGTSVS
jgi:hypothetical protein